MLFVKSLVALSFFLLHVAAEAEADPQYRGQQPAAQAQPYPWGNNAPKATQQGGNRNNNPGNQRPTARPSPTVDPDDDDPPRWTPPPQWGPSRQPFGPRTTASPTPTATRRTTKPPAPKVTSYNSDQIPTTVPDIPKEPVPFAVTCGKKRYDEYDVSNALTAGCFYWKKGTKIAGTEFPKAFPNNQKIDFGDVKGPYFEFPIVDSAPYVSGDPGLDRVIFSTPDCYLAGELTSQGQGRNQYTECSEDF